MKVIVLAGGYDQIELIREFKNRGIEVILIDYLSNPPAKYFADKHYVVSTLDIQSVKEIAIKEKVELITTACTDQALLTVAKVSEDLGLPCYISYETAINVTNKSHMKEIMARNQIPTPKYKIINNINEELSDFEYPFVVKPVDCNSSKGVRKVFAKYDLDDAVKEAISLSRTKSVVVEEFKEGKEISADIYIENGRAKVLLLTESAKINNSNGFTIVQSIFPVNLTKEIINKIESIAQKISESFNIKNSPMLIQFITNGTDIDVLEFSARMGGGTKYKLIEILAGVNIMKEYVNLVLGIKPNIECAYRINYAHVNYCYCYPGIIDRLENFEELKQNETIYEFFQYKTKGMKIEKAQTSSDRVAGYLIISNSREELLEKEKIANKELKVISEEGTDILMHNHFE